MTEFNIGDHVRVVNDPHITEYNGTTGTVQRDDGGTMWPLRVVFDEPVVARGGIDADIFDPDELELLTPPTTAATLRSRADDLQREIETEREAINAVRDGLRPRERAVQQKTTLAAQYRAVADDLEAQK